MKEQILEALCAIDTGPLVRGDMHQAAERTLCYLEELRKWNRQINLTSRKDEKAILERHFSDSLQFALAMPELGETIDIGSGAGFPGIPLKIVFPDMKITLLESQRKRANFLMNVVRKLGMEHVEVIRDRAESLKNDAAYAGRFQYALLRAVTKLRPSLALGAPLIVSGGKLIVKKSPEETADPRRVYEDFHLSLAEEIPIRSHSRTESKLMVFQKCST